MQRRDPELAAMIDFLENDILPINDKYARKILLKSDNFYIGQDGLLYHIDFNRRRNARESFSKFVVPAALSFEILCNVHDHITSAHFGLTKLLVNLSKDIGGKVCLTHSPLNRPCGSRSFLPFVTSSVLTVKGNFLR